MAQTEALVGVADIKWSIARPFIGHDVGDGQADAVVIGDSGL